MAKKEILASAVPFLESALGSEAAVGVFLKIARPERDVWHGSGLHVCHVFGEPFALTRSLELLVCTGSLCPRPGLCLLRALASRVTSWDLTLLASSLALLPTFTSRVLRSAGNGYALWF